jgi:hypothetical protein
MLLEKKEIEQLPHKRIEIDVKKIKNLETTNLLFEKTNRCWFLVA